MAMKRRRPAKVHALAMHGEEKKTACGRDLTEVAMWVTQPKYVTCATCLRRGSHGRQP